MSRIKIKFTMFEVGADVSSPLGWSDHSVEVGEKGIRVIGSFTSAISNDLDIDWHQVSNFRSDDLLLWLRMNNYIAGFWGEDVGQISEYVAQQLDGRLTDTANQGFPPNLPESVTIKNKRKRLRNYAVAGTVLIIAGLVLFGPENSKENQLASIFKPSCENLIKKEVAQNSNGAVAKINWLLYQNKSRLEHYIFNPAFEKVSYEEALQDLRRNKSLYTKMQSTSFGLGFAQIIAEGIEQAFKDPNAPSKGSEVAVDQAKLLAKLENIYVEQEMLYEAKLIRPIQLIDKYGVQIDGRGQPSNAPYIEIVCTKLRDGSFTAYFKE